MPKDANFIKKSFVKELRPILYIKTIVLSILSGVLSFIYITFINSIILEIIEDDIKFKKESIVVLSLTLLCFIWSRKVLSTFIINFSQSFLWTIRLSLIKLVLNSDYESFKSHKNKVYASLVGDVPALTQASLTIIHFSSSVVMLISCFIYIWIISHILCLITLGVVLFGITVYQISNKLNQKHLIHARKLEDDFMKSFNAILSGFKEIFIDLRKGEEIFNDQLKSISQSSIFSTRKALIGLLNNQMIGQLLFYGLIGVTLTVLAGQLNIETGVIVKFLFIILFLLGSVETIMALLPGLIQAKIAFNKIITLELSLRSQKHSVEEVQAFNKLEDFVEIEIKNLEYGYDLKEDSEKDIKAFKVGPINLFINKGDVVFIYGGNGSGKTTFISMLLGLLKPQSGQVLFNKELVDDENQKSYKMMFGVVFSDFYLFDGLYGIQFFDEEKAQYYLKLFEIDHVVSFQDKKFSTINLSTGQRKRLALISILLERKPLIILDEWAADQDPYFRKKFYTKIIPLLKEEGFTIIAITHDDKYYNYADRLYKMEHGILNVIDKVKLAYLQ